jgi:nicotinamide-nucleotide amidase
MKETHRLSIILIGNELLNGDIQDKNAQYLLKKISGSNIEAIRIVSVKDERADIIKVVQEQMLLSRLVICSGGLGPTSDDISVSAVAEALGRPLCQDEPALKRLEQKYQSRGRTLNTNSFKQVQFPEHAEVLANEVGTADACVLTETFNGHVSSVACLPGVPREFSYILDEPLWKWIEKNIAPEWIENTASIRIFGLAESVIGTAIDSSGILPHDITLAYRPQFPEILLTLKSSRRTHEELEQYISELSTILDSSCFFTREKNIKLPETLSQLLTTNNKTLACAESCTGGRIASEITKIPGSSACFRGGIVSYSNEMKVNFLDIPPAMISRVGAVSRECAQHMSDSIAFKTGADYAISTTGIAGPGGATKDKAVGTIYIGFTSHNKHEAFKFTLPWDRERNQIYASWLAMDLVRRDLLGLPLEAKTLQIK